MEFRPVSQEFVRDLLRTPPKSCELDSMPATLMYECMDVLLPSLTQIINESSTAFVPPPPPSPDFNTAIVKPQLKKKKKKKKKKKIWILTTWKTTDRYLTYHFYSNYWKRLFFAYFTSRSPEIERPLQPFSVTISTGHSTETALTRVTNDLTKMDDGKISMVVLLDPSAAFDTTDHEILLARLQSYFGVDCTALAWLKSYVTGRMQFVSVLGHDSEPIPLSFGVPQGSVLGPVLFIMYTKPLSDLIAKHPVKHQSFAEHFLWFMQHL